MEILEIKNTATEILLSGQTQHPLERKINELEYKTVEIIQSELQSLRKVLGTYIILEKNIYIKIIFISLEFQKKTERGIEF